MTRIPPQRETGLPGGNLTSPQTVQFSTSNQTQYTPEPGGEYVFTCRSCGSPDLASLWGSGFLDELTRCNACGARTAEDPDCTIYFPEFAPYDEPAAAEVAA